MKILRRKKLLIVKTKLSERYRHRMSEIAVPIHSGRVPLCYHKSLQTHSQFFHANHVWRFKREGPLFLTLFNQLSSATSRSTNQMYATNMPGGATFYQKYSQWQWLVQTHLFVLFRGSLNTQYIFKSTKLNSILK